MSYMTEVTHVGTEYVEEPVEYDSYECVHCREERFSVHAELGLQEVREQVERHLEECPERGDGR